MAIQKVKYYEMRAKFHAKWLAQLLDQHAYAMEIYLTLNIRKDINEYYKYEAQWHAEKMERFAVEDYLKKYRIKSIKANDKAIRTLCNTNK